jgi:hypothetical protein
MLLDSVYVELCRPCGTQLHFPRACGTTEVVPFPSLLVAGEGEASRRVQCVEGGLDFFVDF